MPKSTNALSRRGLISFATTAIKPFVETLENCPQGSTILDVSLRDFTPPAVLSCDNVVDDVDHVCRARTSVHLTTKSVGNSDFITCTLADLLTAKVPRRPSEKTVVFRPFGLGVLDLAVGKLVYELALQRRHGTVIPSFLPPVWTERRENGR